MDDVKPADVATAMLEAGKRSLALTPRDLGQPVPADSMRRRAMKPRMPSRVAARKVNLTRSP